MNKETNKPESFPPQTQNLPGDMYKMNPKPELISKNYYGSDKLKYKVALITGGDSGNGRSVDVYFAREGVDPAIIYLIEDKDAQETKKKVGREGRRKIYKTKISTLFPTAN